MSSAPRTSLSPRKNRTVVEYAPRELNEPIDIATYRVVSTLPDDLRGLRPSPERVATLMNHE
jgi:hypothetical protein